MKTGHIRITGKVYFEYYELEKPDKKDYYRHGFIDFETVPIFQELAYNKAMEEYEASKRLVEVSNVKKKRISEMKKWVIMYYIDWMRKQRIYGNEPCKAKVNGTATIVELTKK